MEKIDMASVLCQKNTEAFFFFKLFLFCSSLFISCIILKRNSSTQNLPSRNKLLRNTACCTVTIFINTMLKTHPYSKPRATSITNEGITFFYHFEYRYTHLSLWMSLPKSSWTGTWSLNLYMMVVKGGTFRRWLGSEDVMRMPPW